jgi:hypothetical protein
MFIPQLPSLGPPMIVSDSFPNRENADDFLENGQKCWQFVSLRVHVLAFEAIGLPIAYRQLAYPQAMGM